MKDTNTPIGSAQDPSRALPEKTLQVLGDLFKPEDVIELRAIVPDGPATSYCGRLGVPDERQTMHDFIQVYDGQRNLYVGINPRSAALAGTNKAAKASDILERRFVVLDLDLKDAPIVDEDWSQTLEKISCLLSPVLVNNTGNGFHVWLHVREAAGNYRAATAELRTAFQRIGADDISDLPRIARLPWTVNIPTRAKQARGAIAKRAEPDGRFPAPPDQVFWIEWTVSEISEQLCTIADDLALPGRSTAPATLADEGSDASAEKTPTAAPSANMLREALLHLPNDGPFDDREAWVRIGHAIKGASALGGCEADGRDAFLGWSERWHRDGDPEHNARFWDTIENAQTGWGTLMRELERVNPEGRERIRQMEAKETFTAPLATALTPFKYTDPKTIPPLPRLYGPYIGGHISVLAAPGGAGKTSLTMTRVIAMCTGKELILGEKPVAPLRVWYHGAEESENDIAHRVHAVLQHFQLGDKDLGDRLLITSGRDSAYRFKLAHMNGKGAELVPGVQERIAEIATAEKADVIIFDPIAAMHTLNENDNSAINVLMDSLRRLVSETGVALGVLHHSSKDADKNKDANSAAAARGASAFVDAARHTELIIKMRKEEANLYGLPTGDTHRYFQISTARATHDPGRGGRWIELKSVDLENAMPLSLNSGATVDMPSTKKGVAVGWAPPTPKGPTLQNLADAQEELDRHGGSAKFSEKANDWVGWLIADALGLDAGGAGSTKADRTPFQQADFDRIRKMIKDWIKSGHLLKAQERINGKDVPVVRVGNRVKIDLDEMPAPN